MDVLQRPEVASLTPTQPHDHQPGEDPLEDDDVWRESPVYTSSDRPFARRVARAAS